MIFALFLPLYSFTWPLKLIFALYYTRSVKLTAIFHNNLLSWLLWLPILQHSPGFPGIVWNTMEFGDCRWTITCWIKQYVAVWRIRDVYPGSRILIFTHPGSRIPDPKTATKERGEKKFVVITLYVATNFTKLQIILVLKCWRKKFVPIFKEL